jgi:hypothetical protein
MYTNVNLAAPIGVLAFLATAFVLFVLILGLLVSLIARRFVVTKLTLAGAVSVAVLYLGAMLLFSFVSSNRVLARGQEKHFCEVDCHLAYSVVDLNLTKTLGSGPQQKNATGLYYLVTIKTRFDEKTISPTRGDGPLTPNPRTLAIVDANGCRYLPASDTQSLLQQSGRGGTPITTPLRPGEAYTTVFAFDLPADISNPVLLINESDWITHFIIGHENSLAHKKTSLLI